MTAADVLFGLRLSAQAGWNQTEADWRRFLRLQPDGCFVAELDGIAAGTTACFIFGPVAWVAMVLVDEAVRGRGVGTALMRHALAFADGLGIRTVRLDATPLGRPIYEKLGFSEDYTLARYAGVPLGPCPDVPEVRSLPRRYVSGLYCMDFTATGLERRRVWDMLLEETPQAVRVIRFSHIVYGVLVSRVGANAIQLGPGFGARDERHLLLLDAQAQFAGQRVCIDVPLPNACAVEAVAAMGLSVQRSFVRMTRGKRIEENLELFWASSGPEKG